jgi:hypothetical protein
MVHGLETLEVLNRRETGRKPCKTRESVPNKFGLNPYLARRYVNRPWSRSETGGRLFVQGNCRDEGLKESIRH